MPSARIEPIRRDLELLIDENLSPEAFSRQFGQTARRIIEKQDDVNDRTLGRDVKYKTSVDGKPSNKLETAKHRIVAEWDLLETMFQDILTMLRDASPFITGKYRESITLFADNAPVAITQGLPDAGEYFFAATVPYARKIERGSSLQAPDGVFEAVASVASKRFGNVARVRYGFRAVIAGAGVDYIRSGQGSRSDRASERDNRQPAVIIQF